MSFSLFSRCILVAALLLGGTAAQSLVLAVNEGVSYRVGNEEVRARYAAIAADLARLLGQPVTVEPVGAYPTLRQGLEQRSYDIALVHPAHVSIVAIKANGYRLLAVAQGYENYAASFLVRADSPLKALADLKGRRLGAPDEDSITAWMVRAALRDVQVDLKSVTITYTRYQDAVPFFVDNGLTHAGATASAAIVRDWQAKGGRILATTRAVPIKHLIVAPTISAAQQARLRDYFLALGNGDEGRRKLEPTKLRGFIAFDEAELLRLGQWLGL